MSAETRTTNADTGGEKGVKIEAFDLIPTGPLRWLAEMYGRGAKKYASRNWEKGYEWSKSYAALQRHANAFWSGEDLIPQNEAGDDPTAGVPHLVAVAWHAFALLEWATTHPELDDRPNGKLEQNRQSIAEAIAPTVVHHPNEVRVERYYPNLGVWCRITVLDCDVKPSDRIVEDHE